MVTIKFRKDHVCRHRMHLMYPGGVLMQGEYTCALHKNHPGFHMSREGHRWDNADRRIQKLEEEADKPDRPKIFLAR